MMSIPVLLLALLVSLSELSMVKAAQSSRLEVKQSWPIGMTAEICIDHDLNIKCGWEMKVVFTRPITRIEIWDAVVKSKSSDGTTVILRNVAWTGKEPSGTCHRFNAFFSAGEQPSAIAKYTKICAKGGWTDLFESGESKESGDDDDVTEPPPVYTEPGPEDFAVSIQSSWRSGIAGDICLFHTANITCGFDAEIIVSAPIRKFKIWTMAVVDKAKVNKMMRFQLTNMAGQEAQPDNPTCHRFLIRHKRFKKPKVIKGHYTRSCHNGQDNNDPNQGGTVPPPTTEPPTTTVTISTTTTTTTSMPTTSKKMTTAESNDQTTTNMPTTSKKMTTAESNDQTTTSMPTTNKKMTTAESNDQTTTSMPTTSKKMTTAESNDQTTTSMPTTNKKMTTAESNDQTTTSMPTTSKKMTTAESNDQTTTNMPTTSKKMTTAESNDQTTTSMPTTNKKMTTAESNDQTTTSMPTTSKKMTTAESTNRPVTTDQPSTTSRIVSTTEKPVDTTTQQPTVAQTTSTTPSVPPYVPSEPDFDYGTALGKSMKFYFAQRSGPIDDSIVEWRTEASGMTDGSDVGQDLIGGWYDAGDYVKFGFPMAASTTTLLWGLVEYENAYRATGQLELMYKMIRHPLEYFLKCWNNEDKIFYGQVGNGHTDHGQWGRPEDINIARPTYKLDTNNGGSELAAETAAALGAGAIAFKDKDGVFAQDMLEAAKQLYTFADTYKKEYHNSIPGAADFYRSHSGYQDELCWAAAWIFAATGDPYYKTKTLEAMARMDQNPSEFSWDSKAIGCYTLMLKLDPDNKNQYTSKVTNFMQRWLAFNGGITKTPCGLAWLREWGALRYSANTALIALMAADQGVNPGPYREWAEKQIKYMLGANNNQISYLIGYGSQFPKNPHHRAASCPPSPASCTWNEYNSQSPNPHELTGALVGGPDSNDFYEDKRSDYIKNEVATDYNAGFQSVLAGLVNLDIDGTLPKAAPTC